MRSASSGRRFWRRLSKRAKRDLGFLGSRRHGICLTFSFRIAGGSRARRSKEGLLTRGRLEEELAPESFPHLGSYPAAAY
ncbi:UNVERIFIED_CONTAM: hypothetical protein Slati_1363900 [Sesamum latifolium]|uniref:Uncharacterized protein n=1 Tax=Sesamum latifolium TaxID=2727402 RepID=A0AAW2XJ90_9LAMI